MSSHITTDKRCRCTGSSTKTLTRTDKALTRSRSSTAHFTQTVSCTFLRAELDRKLTTNFRYTSSKCVLVTMYTAFTSKG